jgi:hypothetical protein
MSQRNRILIAIAILVVLIGAVVVVETARRAASQIDGAVEDITLVPGSITITIDGEIVGNFSSEDINFLPLESYIDPEEGKKQEGWLLGDILALHIDDQSLTADRMIKVSSSSRDKSIELTLNEILDPQNMVMFDLTNKGTLKLVGLLDKLDERAEWIQDVDRIDITNP